MVHFKLAYGNFTNAKNFADGIAVAAVLFKADDDNHEYKPLYVIIFLNFLNLFCISSKVSFS